MDWGAIRFFKNDGKQLKEVNTPLLDQTGWWNSIVASDVDNDGDMDYIAGNYEHERIFTAFKRISHTCIRK